MDGPGRRIVRYESDGSTSVICDHYEGHRFNSPNDLVVDGQGRVWFTDPRYGDDRSHMELSHESVYRADLQPDGSYLATRVAFDTTKPNGIIVASNMQTLYVAQSDYGVETARELRAYPIVGDGSLGAYDVVHTFGPHRGIDGMRLDSEGCIIATAGWKESGPGPMIYVFEPNGRVLETHPFPINPTNCAFGDADGQSLYVTSLDGYLYRARTERRPRRPGRTRSLTRSQHRVSQLGFNAAAHGSVEHERHACDMRSYTFVRSPCLHVCDMRCVVTCAQVRPL